MLRLSENKLSLKELDHLILEVSTSWNPLEANTVRIQGQETDLSGLIGLRSELRDSLDAEDAKHYGTI